MALSIKTFQRLALTSFAVAFIAFTQTAFAGSWWNNEWTLRKKVTVDTAAAGINDPVGTSAVLVRLHEGVFQFAAAKEDGSDIRFVSADDKTVLPHHIEKYDGLMGEAFVWVKVTDIKPGAQNSFWLYYGNAGPKAVKAEDIKATFDPDTVLDYHFAAAPGYDSSAADNQGEGAAKTSEGAMIGKGLRLDGKNPITVPASPSLQWTNGGGMALTAWFKAPTLQPDAVLFSRREDSRGLVVGLNNGIPYVEIDGKRSTGSAAIAANTWQHLAVVAEPSAINVYLNGELHGTLASPLPALNSPSFLGGDPAANDSGFVGEFDELTISKTPRALGFVKLAALSQGGEKAAKLLVVGADEQQADMFAWLKSGTFGVIIASLTFDGWVVICILAVMAVISWWVMVTKVRYLNATAKGNAIFMKEWQHVAADLTVLDDADAEKTKSLGGRVDASKQKSIRSASVYRIYHIGVTEIRHRLQADKAAGLQRGLAGRSIQAIRASLDGGLVRETQKINSMIVLLTICISGGPFLGLLGTVIGVMITFAAVAAAGEVNVNAIAPGIAAALLATVAGLAVAIPALFGYNYILSRVKDAKDDMHIFIDEFVTKMAEFYKERPDAPARAKETQRELSEAASH